MNTIFKRIINILFILVCFLLVFSIYDYIKYTTEAKKLSDDLKSTFTKDIDSEKTIDFDSLYETNNDYRAWLDINNTNIDYPIVQSDNNEYYLHYNFYKKPSKSGSVFLDFKNSYTDDFNLVLYGHNMKNSTLFSEVNKFKDEEFFKQDNKITLIDDQYKYTYSVFSVYVADATKEFEYLHDINDKKLSLQENIDYVNLLKSKSIYPTTSISTSTDKILTLITCSYEFDDARTIIHANLIKKEKLSK